MYTLPQEIEVWYVIPAVRRELSKSLIKEHQITYEKTGKLLGLTKSAVCQYLSNKRASKIFLHPRALIEVKKAGERISKGKTDAVLEIHKILKLIRKKRLHCELCGGMVNGKPHDCKQIVPRYFDEE